MVRAKSPGWIPAGADVALAGATAGTDNAVWGAGHDFSGTGAADDKRYGNADSRITLGEIKMYLDREMTYAARRHFGRDQQVVVIGNPEKVIVTMDK